MKSKGFFKMQEANLFLIFIERLNKINIEYMTTGSVASIIYGEPRITHDINIILQLHISNIPEFISSFNPEEFYCPPMEVIETEVARETRGHFNIIHHETGFKADIYPVGKDKLHIWAMSKKRKVEVDNCVFWLAPPEYVILRKLEFFREGGSSKHLRDIEKMLILSADIIDFAELTQKITENSLGEEWKKLRGSIKNLVVF